MTIFHFSQFEHELIWRYFKCLNVFLTQCGYYVGKWEILDIVDEDVNNETPPLLEHWAFHGKNVDKVWNLLEWIAWLSFEFEKASHFLDIHFLILVHSILDLIMPFFGVSCVILLTMKLICVLIMHVVLNLPLYHLGTILMLSKTYTIHSSF